MTYQQNQQRIKDIYQMLFEMATGNFAYRLQTDYDDKLDELSKTLNNVAEEMLNMILDSGYVNPHYSYQSLIQATFILNKDFSIYSFSNDVPDMFDYEPEHLLKVNFSKVINPQSIGLLNHIQMTAAADDNYNETIQLIFKTGKGLAIPSFCTISKLLYSNKIIVNSVTTILQDFIAYDTGTATSPRPNDAAIIQELHDYILSHLDAPLPSLKQLSKKFGSNEFKLKDGFRYFFNTSIYHFYNEKRLQKAHLLIQQTPHSIKAIAIMSGFNDYTNFYKSFKKRFGYSPRDLKRDHDNITKE